MPDKEVAHPDEAQDQVQIDANLEQLISELSPILEHLLQQNQELAAKVASLEDLVMNKMIGGLKEAKRSSDLDGLKSRHGEKFKDLLDYKQQVHGADPEEFFSSLLDHLGGGGDEDSVIQELLDRMTQEREGHKALLMGKPAATVEVSAEGEPEAVKEAVAEVPKQVEKAVEEPAVGSSEYFKRYKGKGNSSSKSSK